MRTTHITNATHEFGSFLRIADTPSCEAVSETASAAPSAAPRRSSSQFSAGEGAPQIFCFGPQARLQPSSVWHALLQQQRTAAMSGKLQRETTSTLTGKETGETRYHFEHFCTPGGGCSGVRVAQGSLAFAVCHGDQLLHMKAIAPAYTHEPTEERSHGGTAPLLLRGGVRFLHAGLRSVPWAMARVERGGAASSKQETIYFFRGHQCVAAHTKPIACPASLSVRRGEGSTADAARGSSVGSFFRGWRSQSRPTEPHLATANGFAALPHAARTAMECVCWQRRLSSPPEESRDAEETTGSMLFVGAVLLSSPQHVTLVAASTASPVCSGPTTTRTSSCSAYGTGHWTLDLFQTLAEKADPTHPFQRSGIQLLGPARPLLPSSLLQEECGGSALSVATLLLEDHSLVLLHLQAHTLKEQENIRQQQEQHASQGGNPVQQGTTPQFEQLYGFTVFGGPVALPHPPSDVTKELPSARAVQLLWATSELLFVRYQDQTVRAYAVKCDHSSGPGGRCMATLLHTFGLTSSAGEPDRKNTAIVAMSRHTTATTHLSTGPLASQAPRNGTHCTESGGVVYAVQDHHTGAVLCGELLLRFTSTKDEVSSVVPQQFHWTASPYFVSVLTDVVGHTDGRLSLLCRSREGHGVETVHIQRPDQLQPLLSPPPKEFLRPTGSLSVAVSSTEQMSPEESEEALMALRRECDALLQSLGHHKGNESDPQTTTWETRDEVEAAVKRLSILRTHAQKLCKAFAAQEGGDGRSRRSAHRGLEAPLLSFTMASSISISTGRSVAYPQWLCQQIHAYHLQLQLFQWILQLEDRWRRVDSTATTTSQQGQPSLVLPLLSRVPIAQLCTPPSAPSSTRAEGMTMGERLLESIRERVLGYERAQRARAAASRRPLGLDLTSLSSAAAFPSSWAHRGSLCAVTLGEVLQSGLSLFYAPTLAETTSTALVHHMASAEIPLPLALLVLYATLGAWYHLDLSTSSAVEAEPNTEATAASSQRRREALRRLVQVWVEEQVGCGAGESRGGLPLVLQSWLQALELPSQTAHVSFLCFAADAALPPAELMRALPFQAEAKEEAEERHGDKASARQRHLAARVSSWLRLGPHSLPLLRSFRQALCAALLAQHWLGTETGTLIRQQAIGLQLLPADRQISAHHRRAAATRQCEAGGLECADKWDIAFTYEEEAEKVFWLEVMAPALQLVPLPPTAMRSSPLPRQWGLPPSHQFYRQLLEIACLTLPSFSVFAPPQLGREGQRCRSTRQLALELYARCTTDLSRTTAMPNLTGLLSWRSTARAAASESLRGLREEEGNDGFLLSPSSLSSEVQWLVQTVRHSSASTSSAAPPVTTPAGLILLTGSEVGWQWLLRLFCACRAYREAVRVCDHLLHYYSAEDGRAAAASPRTSPLQDRVYTIRAALLSLLPPPPVSAHRKNRDEEREMDHAAPGLSKSAPTRRGTRSNPLERPSRPSHAFAFRSSMTYGSARREAGRGWWETTLRSAAEDVYEEDEFDGEEEQKERESFEGSAKKQPLHSSAFGAGGSPQSYPSLSSLRRSALLSTTVPPYHPPVLGKDSLMRPSVSGGSQTLGRPSELGTLDDSTGTSRMPRLRPSRLLEE